MSNNPTNRNSSCDLALARYPGRPRAIWIVLLIVPILVGGCMRSRRAHRVTADSEAYARLHEIADFHPWQPRPQFSVYPNPASRWYIPGSPDCPPLPQAAPQLYAYQLPLAAGPVDSTASQTDPAGPASQQMPGSPEVEADPGGEGPDDSTVDEPTISPIPPNAWYDIPDQCRKRMFDFQSLREEADRTAQQFEFEITAADETAPRLDLPGIVDLALLNSREYQTQKEALYRVALRLALERYGFVLFPLAGGNGADLDFSHNRNNGITVNNLSIPSRLALQKTLLIGGDVLASFANNILLTFDGPQGFAADVSSDVLLQFTKPLIQHDIQFESLTQAERNVAYAARDFARFRKEFFTDFASQYYSLIRAYRQIEIDSQNYFSLVRAFNQAEAEYRAGLVPRFQVDQVEQNLLSGRGSLIGTCNDVERSLDSLKLNMGIPVETEINIDLGELESLTQSDQLAVSGDLINRVRRRLEQNIREPVQIELLSTSVVLIDRLLDASQMRQQMDLEPLPIEDLRELRVRLLIDSARISATEIETTLRDETNSQSPSLPVIFQRTLALTEALHGLIEQQFALADLLNLKNDAFAGFEQRFRDSISRANSLRDGLQQMIEDEAVDSLPELVAAASLLHEQTAQLVAEIDRATDNTPRETTPQQKLQRTIDQAQTVLVRSQQVIEAIGSGLEPIGIEMDEAMLTALVLRYDLMNQRGFLADDWRQIKLAADELRSVLNLDARQRIGTDRNSNSPFDFTFDESRSELGLSFDAPLNRLAQRNSYRFALINYQAAVRDLGGLEDNIKFAIRNNLRSLALDREQYLIAVASAALAFERVVSTSLEFRLGTGGVSARDFLEAQTAYIDALSAVASRHINYIVDRTQLFLDLELLEVNDQGFWEELYDDSFQPTAYFDLPPWSLPAYGGLPPVNYSAQILCPMQAAPGQAAIHKPLSEPEGVPPASVPPAGAPPAGAPPAGAPPAGALPATQQLNATQSQWWDPPESLPPNPATHR